MMLENAPDVLNVDELAVLLRVGRSAAYELLRSGRLRSVKIGNRIIITKNALRCFLGERDDVQTPATMRSRNASTP